MLSPGADPTVALLKFANDEGFGGDRFETISLGQGQSLPLDSLVEWGLRVGW